MKTMKVGLEFQSYHTLKLKMDSMPASEHTLVRTLNTALVTALASCMRMCLYCVHGIPVYRYGDVRSGTRAQCMQARCTCMARALACGMWYGETVRYGTSAASPTQCFKRYYAVYRCTFPVNMKALQRFPIGKCFRTRQNGKMKSTGMKRFSR